MTAHGADPDNVDEETFGDICIMYNDGVIGNLGLLQVLGSLTAGQFNKMLPKGSTPYKLQDIIHSSYDYIFPPLSEQDKKAQVNKRLLQFIQMMPDAPQIILGVQ